MTALPQEPAPGVVQEVLFKELIGVVPEDSAHGDDWHRAFCDCGWETTGAERTARDAAYDHIADVHMLGLAAYARLLAGRMTTH